jgi:predicted phosphate transport protein (TIGR00153 family)
MIHVWLKKLMPRQDAFTGLFVEQASQARQATMVLQDLLEGKDPQHNARRLGELEKQADLTAEKIYALLNSSFATPFRRGEIRALVGALDSVVDYAEDVARRMDIYRVGAPTAEMALMASKAKACTELIAQAMPLLDNVSKGAESINAICAKIHQAEDEADEMHDNALRALYAVGSKEPADRARALEKIFDLIEEVVDACEDVANILGDIVAENA